MPARAKFTPSGLLAITLAAFGEEFDVKGPMQPVERVGAVGVVGICGPLLEHPNPDWDDYDSIQQRAQVAFLDPEVQVVALRINSPGGAAAGCIELARALRDMSEETRRGIAVFVDGMAASAAYAIASCATLGIFSPPTSTVGSMAVYKTQVDQTALDRAMGLKFEFIASDGADLKLAGNPHIAMTDEVRVHEQEKVNLMTDLFYSLVEEMRGISRAQSTALRGAALLASQGLENGLVNELKAYGAFLSDLQTPLGRKPTNMPPKTSTAAQAKASDKEWEALRTLAESDDESKRKMARKMLATMLGEGGEGGEGGGSDPEKDKKDEEARAKAEQDKKDEEAKAAAAKQDEEAKAKALADAGTLAVAQELQTVKAELATERAARVASEQATAVAKAEAQKTTLLASRPDFSDALRATLAKLPLADIQAAVKDLPRVHAGPRAAAAATLTPPTRGAEATVATAVLSERQQSVLDGLRRKPRTASAEHGSDGSLTLHLLTPEAAQARLEELDALAAASGE